jgi:hypothetical protein
MAFTLYAATVPAFIQIGEAVFGLLDKAEAFRVDQELAPEDIIQARLIEDMFSFAHQVRFVANHSYGAIEGVRKGVFGPDLSPPPATFGELRQIMSDAITGLRAVDPEEIDSFIGRDMRFEFGDFRMDFTAEDFLLSFSQPNFYFHATTVYDILRMKGAPVGKRDFMGAVRLKV